MLGEPVADKNSRPQLSNEESSEEGCSMAAEGASARDSRIDKNEEEGDSSR